MSDAKDSSDLDLLRLTGLLHDLKNQAHHLVAGLESVQVAANDRGQLAALRAEAGDLGDQLTHLLLWLRLDHHQHGLQEDLVGVLAFLQDLAEEARDRGQRDGIRLDVQADGALTHFLDRMLIESVVRSALDNALRHARSRALVCAREEEGCLELTVEDDGPGYPEALLTSPEMALSQPEPTARRTGLGLMLARGAAAAHQSNGRQGTIHLERSHNLGGARLRILLP